MKDNYLKTRTTLSARERAVIHSLSYGLTAKEIASDLQLATPTVRKHIDNASKKLGLKKETALSRWITEVEHNLIPTV